jgi:hypothetical protein
MAERAAQFRLRFAALEAEIGKVIVGQPETVRGILTCLFVGGHCLLEGVPGLGKTLLVLDTASHDAERLYERAGWTKVGVIPDYALMPDGAFCDTIVYYRRL